MQSRHPHVSSPRHCRATLGEGSRPIMPNARAYNPDPMQVIKKLTTITQRRGRRGKVSMMITYLRWCPVCIPYRNTVQVPHRAPPNPRWSIQSRPRKCAQQHRRTDRERGGPMIDDVRPPGQPWIQNKTKQKHPGSRNSSGGAREEAECRGHGERNKKKIKIKKDAPE
jgi:hypothetical protein